MSYSQASQVPDKSVIRHVKTNTVGILLLGTTKRHPHIVVPPETWIPINWYDSVEVLATPIMTATHWIETLLPATQGVP